MATTKIPAEFLSTNAIAGTLIADNAITTVHIAQNAITSVQIPNNSIGTVQIALNTVTGVHIAQNSVTTVQLATNSVNTLNIADDQVTADKLASGAVVTASIVDLNVTEGKIAANSITASKIPDGSITATQLGANSVTLAKMASLTRGSILVGDSAADVAALAIGTSGYVLKSDGTDAAWAAEQSIAANSVTSGMIASNSILTRHIDDDQVTGDQIAANTIATANIADNAVDGTKIASNSILTRHIDDDQVTGDQLADTITVVTSVVTPLVDAAIIDGENFKVNGGQGSDGQVLTSTGSGVAWEAAGGGSTTGIDDNADAVAITIDSAENVGIGETSPKAPGGTAATTLTVKATNYAQWISTVSAAATNTTTWRSIVRPGVFQIQTTNDAMSSEQTAYEIVRPDGSNSISYHRFLTGTTELLRLTSAGGFELNPVSGKTLTILNNGGSGEGLNFGMYTNHNLHFTTNNTERMRITSGGLLAVGGTNTYHNAANGVYGRLGVTETAASGASTLVLINTSTSLGSYTSTFTDGSFTSNTANYSFYTCFTGNGSTISDVEFSHRGDGQAYADGAWNGGGADYAEYFEWADGNSGSEDRRGWSVVLVNEKIRRATSDDTAGTIIGVISGNPGVVGDSDIQGKWKGKYLTDDFGTHIRENVQAYSWKTTDAEGEVTTHSMHEDRVPEGVTVPTVEENDTFTSTTVDRKKDNPSYVEGQAYVQRENRPEWDTVGLMGKLRILKTEQKGTNWIKMRDISATVEEWLVK
jgi:hypothetical protein